MKKFFTGRKFSGKVMPVFFVGVFTDSFFQNLTQGFWVSSLIELVFGIFSLLVAFPRGRRQ